MNRTNEKASIKGIAAWVQDCQQDEENYCREDESLALVEPREKTFHTAPSTPGADASNLVFPEDDFLSGAPRVTKKNIWSIVWSDLMMTMFIYFALLYIFSSMKHQYGSSPGDASAATPPGEKNLPARITTIPDFYALSEKTVQTGELSHLASVDLIPDKAVRIALSADLLFDLGKAELKNDARQQLKALAPLVMKSPYLVNVVGHTDDLPIHSPQFSSNWELSVIRACVVARFFMEEMGVPENKFYLSGHSSLQPVKPNTSPHNRAANRRVELIITKERPLGTFFAEGLPTDDLLEQGDV